MPQNWGSLMDRVECLVCRNCMRGINLRSQYWVGFILHGFYLVETSVFL